MAAECFFLPATADDLRLRIHAERAEEDLPKGVARAENERGYAGYLKKTV